MIFQKGIPKDDIGDYDTPEMRAECLNCKLPDCYGDLHAACPLHNPQKEISEDRKRRSVYLAELGYASLKEAVPDLILDGMSISAVSKLLRANIQTVRHYVRAFGLNEEEAV